MTQPSHLPEHYRLQTLRRYIESYNEAVLRHLASPAVTHVNPRTATKGDITNPDGRLAPERIQPWSEAEASQERQMIETILRAVESAGPNQPLFPSKDNILHISQDLGRLDSENALLLFDADTLHKPAVRVLRALLANDSIRTALTQYVRQQHTSSSQQQPSFEYIPGEITFPTHLNLLPKTLKRKRDAYEGDSRALPNPVQGPADVFCIFEPPEYTASAPRLLFLKEAKASHKLTASLVDGAVAEGRTLEPRAIMNRGAGDNAHPDPETCEYWFAAVCAQIYSSLIRKSARYGVVSTGARYIFLSIDPDDLSVLRYSLSDTPSLTTSPLMRVVALSLLAMQDGGTLPENTQRDDISRGRGLIWATGTLSFTTAGTPAAHQDSDYVEDSASPSDGSDKNGQRRQRNDRQQAFEPPPCAHDLPSGYPSPQPPCPPTSLGKRGRQDEAYEEQCGSVDAGIVKRVRRESNERAVATPHPSPQSSRQGRLAPVQPVNVADSPYCTQQCLRSLIGRGKPDDTHCPNYAQHLPGTKLAVEELYDLLRAQLGVKSKDVAADWGYTVLTAAAGNAPMLKIHLAATGHVFIAKAFTPSDLRKMRREANLYGRLRRLQGTHIPVCLGSVELYGDEILRHDTWDGELVIKGLLLLGWAGLGVDGWPRLGLGRKDEADHAFVRDLTIEARKALAEIHEAGVWHRDVALRNVLVQRRQAANGKWQLQVMFIDFELSWTRTNYRRYRRRMLRGTQAVKSDEELDKEFAGKLTEEWDRCSQEMEEWCRPEGAEPRCPHSCHRI